MTKERQAEAAPAGEREAHEGCSYLGIPYRRKGIDAPRYVCFAQRAHGRPFADVDVGWQAAYCTTEAHSRCPFFQRAQGSRPSTWWQFWRRT